MIEIDSKYKVATIKNGKPFYGEIKLIIQLTKSKNLEIKERYSGKGFCSQGYIESIPKEGYDNWKKGINKGIEYAYSKMIHQNGLRVIIREASGLTTDTNPILLGFIASRAILDKIENNETYEEKEKLEEYTYSSHNYELNTLPDFDTI